MCQPYIRAPPEIHKRIQAEKQELANDLCCEKREYFDDEGNQISRKRMKRLRRYSRKAQHSPYTMEIGQKLIQRPERILSLCQLCRNPLGLKCEFEMCRLCCREKCRTEDISCPGHGTRMKKNRNFKDQQEQEDINELEGDCIDNKFQNIITFKSNL